MNWTSLDKEPRHTSPRISGPHYLITTVDDHFWWLPEEQRPVYITPAHWWDR